MYQGHCGGKRIFKRLAGTQDFASSGCRLLWNGAEPVSRVSKVDDDLQALAILFEDAQVVADDHPIYPQTVETPQRQTFPTLHFISQILRDPRMLSVTMSSMKLLLLLVMITLGVMGT